MSRDEGNNLVQLAAKIMTVLATKDPTRLTIQQVLRVAEEAGEFVGAYRRWAGMARRTGTYAEVEEELADVIISAFCAANVLGIDIMAAISRKEKVIFTRAGWGGKGGTRALEVGR